MHQTYPHTKWVRLLSLDLKSLLPKLELGFNLASCEYRTSISVKAFSQSGIWKGTQKSSPCAKISDSNSVGLNVDKIKTTPSTDGSLIWPKCFFIKYATFDILQAVTLQILLWILDMSRRKRILSNNERVMTFWCHKVFNWHSNSGFFSGKTIYRIFQKSSRDKI